VPVEDAQAHGGREGNPVRQTEPDMLGLGILALVPGVLSVAFAVSYFFRPLAHLAAALTMPLGVMARGDERSRVLGTTALAFATVAIVWATVVIVLY
jgi:hypothetical protein